MNWADWVVLYTMMVMPWHAFGWALAIHLVHWFCNFIRFDRVMA